jgi:hypothetical protein
MPTPFEMKGSRPDRSHSNVVGVAELAQRHRTSPGIDSVAMMRFCAESMVSL